MWTTITAFVANIKTYLIIAVTTLLIGFLSGAYIAWKYVSNTKQQEITELTNSIARERQQYINKLIDKERENASITEQFSKRIDELNSEKAKVLDRITRLQYSDVRMFNASCVASDAKDRASTASAIPSTPATAYCQLNNTAESALFGYIKQVEELNVYALVCKQYVDKVEEQRQRMMQEQKEKE